MALEIQQKTSTKKGESACCPSVVTARNESNLSEVVTSPEKRHLFNMKKRTSAIGTSHARMRGCISVFAHDGDKTISTAMRDSLSNLTRFFVSRNGK